MGGKDLMYLGIFFGGLIITIVSVVYWVSQSQGVKEEQPKPYMPRESIPDLVKAYVDLLALAQSYKYTTEGMLYDKAKQAILSAIITKSGGTP